jgi:uncharacterized protein YicC (UPF0701 family)
MKHRILNTEHVNFNYLELRKLYDTINDWFGKSNFAIIHQKITVEVKLLNSKGLDLNVRMPSLYREMELGLRTSNCSARKRKETFLIFIESTAEISNEK